MFDWQKFLSRHGISYSTRGPNVGKDHIVTHCPMCGSEDRGQHMEIHLHGRGWRCLRRHLEHKGRKAAPLVKALLQCSYEAAEAITQERMSFPDDWRAHIKKLQASIDGRAVKKPPKILKLPPEFKSFEVRRRSADLYWNYLLKRDFTENQILKLTPIFGVRYAISGANQGRIIFPVYHKGRLVTWTGRSCYKSVTPRYKALSATPTEGARKDTPIALGAITNFFLWHDYIMKGNFHTFILTEGPFDALKVNILGRRKGICATCCTTSQPSNTQLGLLRDLLPKFERRILMMDRGTERTSQFVSSLIPFDLERVHLKQIKDPGELRSTAELLRLIKPKK